MKNYIMFGIAAAVLFAGFIWGSTHSEFWTSLTAIGAFCGVYGLFDFLSPGRK